MFNTFHDIIFLYRLPSLPYTLPRWCIKALRIWFEPELIVSKFYLAENQLDGIVIRAVGDIEENFVPLLGINLRNFLRTVTNHIVLIDHHSSERVLVSQLQKKLFVLCLVDTLLEEHHQIHTVPLRYSSYTCYRFHVHFPHIDLEIFMFSTPGSRQLSLRCK